MPKGNTFFIDAQRVSSKLFYFNSLLIDNETFPTVVTFKEPHLNYDCVKATVNNRALELRAADCNNIIGVVCMALWNSDLSVTCNGTSISDEKTTATDNYLEYVFNPILNSGINKGANRLRTLYRDMFKRLNQTAAFKSMFSMLWYSTIPCFDVKDVTSQTDGEKGMLRYCQWKGKQIPCSAIFTQVSNVM